MSATAIQLEQPIAGLGLNRRVTNPLERAGIATIGQLVKRTYVELWRIKGLGVVMLGEINAALAERGLALAKDPEETAAAKRVMI